MKHFGKFSLAASIWIVTCVGSSMAVASFPASNDTRMTGISVTVKPGSKAVNGAYPPGTILNIQLWGVSYCNRNGSCDLTGGRFAFTAFVDGATDSPTYQILGPSPGVNSAPAVNDGATVNDQPEATGTIQVRQLVEGKLTVKGWYVGNSDNGASFQITSDGPKLIGDDGDVPIPFWALALLGIGMILTLIKTQRGRQRGTQGAVGA